MKVKHGLLLVLACLAIAGCGLNEGDLVGTWEQNIDTEGKSDSVAESLAQSFTEMSDSSLELREDGAATYTTLGIGLEGTWVLDKDERTVTLTDESGKISLKFDVSEDGKRLLRSGRDSAVFFEKSDS